LTAQSAGILTGLSTFFRQLPAWLRGGRLPYTPVSISFPHIDAIRLRRELDLDAQGAEMGARNLPSPDHAALDEVEQRIVAAIESQRALAYDRYLANVRAYSDRLGSLQIQVLLQQAATAGEETKTDLNEALIKGRDRLFGLQNKLAGLKRELEAFRIENRLQRSARGPDSRIFHWGVVALLLVVEAVLNGNFLARGLELGLLGGVVEAFLIAVLNVGSGLVMGWLALRQLYHRRWTHKVPALLALILYAGAAVGFNLLVAHYRDALGGSNPENAGMLALQTFLSKPFHIIDINSCLLLAMGIGFSLIAVADGYLMDDPYPGYGRIARDCQIAEDEFRETKEEETQRLSELEDSALGRLDGATSGIERRRAEYYAVLQRRDGFRQQFIEHLDHLEQAADQLLGWYRQANREARSTPAPNHFSMQWRMVRPNLQGGADGDAGAAPFPAEEAGQVLNGLQKTRLEILAAYSEAIGSYASIEELSKSS